MQILSVDQPHAWGVCRGNGGKTQQTRQETTRQPPALNRNHYAYASKYHLHIYPRPEG